MANRRERKIGQGLMEPHDLANLLGEEFVAELVAEAYAQKDNPPPDRRGKWERKRS